MKSMCQEARRNSPSVADWRPASFWSPTTSLIASSSMPRSSSASMSPVARSSRAFRRCWGRSRLPTWSARKGGLSRLMSDNSPVPEHPNLVSIIRSRPAEPAAYCEMERVEIKVRDNGPYKVTGPVTIIDADGNEFELPDDGRPVALCRCGGSSTKPFCDTTHKRNGFDACERAADPEWRTGPGGAGYVADP